MILDEVHHASSDLAFGQACEIAFPDHLVSHRLMTSGTPFRSDQNKILGNWVNYVPIEENAYQCVPDFAYRLAEALADGVIPAFSFVSLAGEFTYSRGEYRYEGKTFENAQTEQELRDSLNTAIHVEGGWVEDAIKWAHERMKRDRAKGLPECATYIRVPKIETARKMKERIERLTNERVLVVVSKDDDPNSTSQSLSQENSSKLIEQFAQETGVGATPWIIGVGMLGEGVSIKRLKYRIHATNIQAPLSFIQDLGRLLRKFPDEEPEPVETLIPAHPDLINLAVDVMNQVAHVIQEKEQNNSEDDDITSGEGNGETNTIAPFQPIASTGEFDTQIVDGEKISNQYAKVAEWAIVNHSIGRGWAKTPAHFAQMLQEDSALFELFRQQYESANNETVNISNDIAQENIPDGFPSEYATLLNNDKEKCASKQVSTKVKRLAYLLYPNADHQKITETIKEIHNKAKLRCGVTLSPCSHIGYKDWERIYLWVCDRIAHAKQLKGTEDL